MGSANQLVRGRPDYLSGRSSIAVVAVVAVGEPAFGVAGGPRSHVPDLGAALLWSATTVLGMTPTSTPVSAAGQLVTVAGCVVGLLLITTPAGTLGSFLPESHTENRRSAEPASAAEEHERRAATGAPR